MSSPGSWLQLQLYRVERVPRGAHLCHSTRSTRHTVHTMMSFVTTSLLMKADEQVHNTMIQHLCQLFVQYVSNVKAVAPLELSVHQLILEFQNLPHVFSWKGSPPPRSFSTRLCPSQVYPGCGDK